MTDWQRRKPRKAGSHHVALPTGIEVWNWNGSEFEDEDGGLHTIKSLPADVVWRRAAVRAAKGRKPGART